MPNYSSQYSPYLDAADAFRGPASGLMRVLTELPQQRAQARLLGSQVDENVARIGLMGEQGRTEQAQQQMLGQQGGMYGAQAGVHNAEAESKRLLNKIVTDTLAVLGQGTQDFSAGNTASPHAQALLSLNAAANMLNKNPNGMGQIVQGVNLVKAGGDPLALSNVQAGGRGIPFERSIGGGVTTPAVLPAGASLATGASPTNAPTISLTAPGNPGSTASVQAATISARAKLLGESIKQMGDAGAPPDQIKALLEQALSQFGAAPVALPTPGTNAPVVRRYNPATGKIE